MGNIYPGLRRRPTGRALEYADFQSRMTDAPFQRGPLIDLTPFRRVTPAQPKPPLRYVPPAKAPPGYEWQPARVARDLGRVIGGTMVNRALSRVWPAWRVVSTIAQAAEVVQQWMGNEAVEGRPAIPVMDGADLFKFCEAGSPYSQGADGYCGIDGQYIAEPTGVYVPGAAYPTQRRYPVGFWLKTAYGPRGRLLWSYKCNTIGDVREVVTVGPFTGEFYPEVVGVPARPASYATPSMQPVRPRWPALDPGAMPLVGPPAPTPLPVPYRVLPYWQPSGVERTERGHGVRVAPQGRAEPVGATYEITAPATGSSGGPPATIPPEHARARPGRGVRERKTIATPSDGTSKVALVFGAATEMGDLIDVFMDALPAGHKRPPWLRWKKHLTMAEKLQAIAYNYKYLDLNKLSHGFVENQAEDWAFGKIGRGLRNLNRHMGRPVGVQTGPGAPGKVPDGTQTGPAPWKGWSNDLW